MEIAILKPDKFPLQCSNLECGISYDTEKFKELILKRGIVFADCGDVIFQGFTCSICNKTTIIKTNREEPLIDCRNFLLQPIVNYYQSIYEQYRLTKNAERIGTHLGFKFFSAWNESQFSLLPTNYDPDHFSMPPLFVQEDRVERLKIAENKTGKVKLRRLYPDIPHFRHILTLYNPPEITDVSEAYDTTIPSIRQTSNKYEAIEYFAQTIDSKSTGQLVFEKMLELECSDFSENDLLEIYKDETKTPISSNNEDFDLWSLIDKVSWEDRIFQWDGWRKAHNKLLEKILKKLPHTENRRKLNDWVEKVKPGRALIVDAPMGMGKSSSIVSCLSDNLGLSAVIFMPTKALCRILAHSLKQQIAKNIGLKDCHAVQPGSDCFNFARPEYLVSEVFLVEGVNEECPFFQEILNNYKKRWYNKREYCSGCEKKPNCRFRTWPEVANRSRIIVATHNQYNVFNKNTELHKWIRSEEGEEPDEKQRDMFIVDEDLAFTQCYSPITLDPEDFRRFCSSIPQFFLDNSPEHQDIIDKINILFGLTNKPDNTTVIPPVDPELEIPKDIKEKWLKSKGTIHAYIPDYLNHNELVGNLLDVVEHGIKFGVVVQRYASTNKIFFPNPTTYNLSKCPPHVFFDGTKFDGPKLKDKFLEKKLIGVEFEKFEIKNYAKWPHSVHQNTNTDLSAVNIEKEKENVGIFILNIFNELGKERKYFIHTTKAIHNRYLHDFLKSSEGSEYQIIVNHYGNIRGSNDAQDYDVHIMLGSFTPSDAVEIAMSLEFLQDKLKGKELMATYPNLWRWGKSISQRTYEHEYTVIDEISKAYRHAEQRQALARTRSIFHKVDFYIISKENVSDYEPSLPLPVKPQYREDLFPPRKARKDKKYEEVKIAILDYLNNNNKACDMDIHWSGGFHRHTIHIYREQMFEEGLIGWVTKQSKSKKLGVEIKKSKVYYKLMPKKKDECNAETTPGN